MRRAFRRRCGRPATGARSERRSDRFVRRPNGGRRRRSRCASSWPAPRHSKRLRRRPRSGLRRRGQGLCVLDPASGTSPPRFAPTSARSAQLLPLLGHHRLSAITRTHLQDYVESRIAAGKAPSTVRNAILPLRAIYRRAHHRDEVTTNPTVSLQLPANRSQRDRVARPDEAAALIAALPIGDRVLVGDRVLCRAPSGRVTCAAMGRCRP